LTSHRTILTTHVGSLPRGDELVPLLLARDHGKPYDSAEFDHRVQLAVDAAVARQVEAGVSVVSDGELGKVGYSTYVTERLSGFGGNVARKPALDLAPLPELRKKLAVIMGEQEFLRSSCVAPVKLRNLTPCRDDIRRFQKSMTGRGVQGFMNAASPGLITAFQPNAYYPSHEAYLTDLVEAMRPEYTAIAASGFQLQLDCPDLAMSRHTGFQDASEAEFLKIAAANVEALKVPTIMTSRWSG
jgi:5-methyltetrahydropteroyltriglutamate--homocysteine methyltransferase